jgi:8-amino-7-oxononanoate synthase
MSFLALQLAKEQIADLNLQLLKRKLRVTQSRCDTNVVVGDKQLKAFCSNDYLGLASHLDLIKALAQGSETYGVGSGASHLISGHSAAHELLEKKLASFQETYIPNARALFFSSGYLANLTAITGFAKLAPRNELSIYSAKLNHASLIDGVRLASAQNNAVVHLFDHTQLDSLLDVLKKDTKPLKLIVTDGVFSMDGDIAPLDVMHSLANKYNAFLMVDECHATGIFGKTGRGTPELFNLEGKIDII